MSCLTVPLPPLPSSGGDHGKGGARHAQQVGPCCGRNYSAPVPQLHAALLHASNGLPLQLPLCIALVSPLQHALVSSASLITGMPPCTASSLLVQQHELVTIDGIVDTIEVMPSLQKPKKVRVGYKQHVLFWAAIRCGRGPLCEQSMHCLGAAGWHGHAVQPANYPLLLTARCWARPPCAHQATQGQLRGPGHQSSPEFPEATLPHLCCPRSRAVLPARSR